ncbi:MAG: hypothetical protein LBT45_02145 [Rickettsiales bacterium]|jgi:hypothetical protein|nr:hypothetical protein [Rickettsiales bacterium]
MGTEQSVGEIRQVWSNAQWGEPLGVKPEEIPELKELVENAYNPFVTKYKKAGSGWHFELWRRHDAPSGYERWVPVGSHNKSFPTSTEAAIYANNVIMPKLEMNEFVAEMNKVPTKVLQLLRVKIK